MDKLELAKSFVSQTISKYQNLVTEQTQPGGQMLLMEDADVAKASAKRSAYTQIITDLRAIESILNR